MIVVPEIFTHTVKYNMYAKLTSNLFRVLCNFIYPSWTWMGIWTWVQIKLAQTEERYLCICMFEYVVPFQVQIVLKFTMKLCTRHTSNTLNVETENGDSHRAIDSLKYELKLIFSQLNSKIFLISNSFWIDGS